MSIVDAHGRAYTPRNAQMHVKIVFYKHVATGRYLVGAPENFPAPRGMEKIVCGSTHEVEKYSQLIRDQDRRDEEMEDEAREAFEGPVRKKVRSELHDRLLAAKDNVNRQFLEYAIKKIDEKDEQMRKNKGQRVSYQHVEGYEAGK